MSNASIPYEPNKQITIGYDDNGSPRTWIEDGKIVSATPYGVTVHDIPAPETNPAFESMKIQGANYGRGFRAEHSPGFSRDELDRGYYADQGLRDYYEKNNPVQQFVGELIPTLPTMALGGRSRAGQLGASALVGGGEANYDYRPGGTDAGDVVTGMATGMLGDQMGTSASRVIGGAGQLLNSLFKKGPRAMGNTLGMNPAALRAQERGYRVPRVADLGAPGSPYRDTTENLELSAAASIFPPGYVARSEQYNQREFMQRMTDTFETPGVHTELTDGFLIGTKRALDFKQRAVNSMLNDVPIPRTVLGRIEDRQWMTEAKGLRTYPTIRQYYADMETFERSIKSGDSVPVQPELPVLSGRELVALRSSLTEDAAQMTNNANRAEMGSIINDLDNNIADALPQDSAVQGEWGKLREQWQLYRSLKSPGVMGDEGNINYKTFRNRLKSESNFGEKAIVDDLAAQLPREQQELIAQRLGTTVEEIGDQMPEIEFSDPAVRELIGDTNTLANLRKLSNTSNTARSGALMDAVQSPRETTAALANSWLLSLLHDTGANPGGMAHSFARGFANTPEISVPLRSGLNKEPGFLPTPLMRPGASEAGRVLGIAGDEQTRDAALYPFVGTYNAIKSANE